MHTDNAWGRPHHTGEGTHVGWGGGGRMPYVMSAYAGVYVQVFFRISSSTL